MMLLSLRLRARAGWLVSCHALIRTTITFAAAGAVVFAGVESLHAANRFWITSTGGAFETAANWSTAAGGAGGASVPGAADVANFTRGSIYTVTFGADVTNLGLLVNNDNVTFDLNGKVYTSTASTQIGTTNAQTGRLTLRNGTLAMDSASDQIFVGSVGSTGFLTVSTGGRIGNGTIDPNLVIGNGGTATLRIEDNGFADLGFLSIGHQSIASSTGTVTVSGPNAILNTSSGILVGRVGNGTLNVEGAGTVAAIGASTIGDWLGANGIAKVTGIGSSWIQTGALVVADEGDASVSVESAGLLNTLAAVTIGNASTGIGAGIVTGADSKWNMSGPLSLGVDGLGNFVVSIAGRASTAGAVQMSVNAGSESNAVVTGAGSRWSTGTFTVGNRGKANLTISAGGVIDTTGNVVFGTNNTAVSTAKLTGDNSTWNISGGLNIAALGSATLSVETNSLLNVTGAVTLGNPAGSQVGTLNLTGGTITAGSFTRAAGAAFNWTSGTLLVNGGTFNNAGENLIINGSGLDDLPALRLSAGAQSTVGNLPNLTIGSSRRGAVVVSGGSSFNLTTASIGSLDGGSGSLVVEGTNSQFNTSGDLGVGGSTVAAGGLGNVTIGLGGTVRTDSTLRLWNGGTITLSGGTLRFNTLATNGGKFTFNSGTIQAASALNANAAVLEAIIGSTRVLGFGRKIDSLTNAFNVQSDLNVTGGGVAGGVLNVNSGVIVRFEAAGTGTFTGGVVNASGGRIFVTDASLSAGTTLTNSGDIFLSGGAATINGTGVTNTGIVSGSGRINGVITNNTAGQVRVAAGQRLEILGATGTNINNGLIDVDGGTIEFGRAVTNSNVSPSTGLIAARDATLRFHGGLFNSGALTFSAGVSDVFGDINNQSNLATPGRIVVTGGAQANFYDDVVNTGTIQVSAAGSLQSTVVFLGNLSGNGVVGGGHVFIEGDARPGFSPGTMAFGGDVSFGPLSSLNIELAGAMPGTQYDRVTVAETAAIGGDLVVSFLNGYRPAIGASFQILSAAGGVSGTFADESLPELAGGASWNVEYGNNAVTLEVGGVLGDFNRDGRVDAADYSVWRDKLGTNTLAADASGNGSVDQADYSIWRANFGQVAVSGGGSAGSAITPVPEPSTLVLLSLVVTGVAIGVQRRTSPRGTS